MLQMLTGKPYDEIARLIDWGVQTDHYTTWKELRGALTELGWQIDELHEAVRWDDIAGLAIVHVIGDHFILYDAESKGARAYATFSREFRSRLPEIGPTTHRDAVPVMAGSAGVH